MTDLFEEGLDAFGQGIHLLGKPGERCGIALSELADAPGEDRPPVRSGFAGPQPAGLDEPEVHRPLGSSIFASSWM